MSSRISQTFTNLQKRNQSALVTFITAGDPDIESTPELISQLGKAGSDIVELGIPYSDPLADGPTIQAASQRALEKGVTPPMVLDMVKKARQLTDIPILLMTSYNLVLIYGLEKFAREAKDAGADGAILTDLPPEEAAPWKQAAEAAEFDTVFLVAPTSTDERIASITKISSGFIYCVSRLGVTGAKNELPSDLAGLVKRIKNTTDKPVCVGFGISTPSHVATVSGFSEGAVIGSSLVDILYKEPEQNRANIIKETVKAWKDATIR